MSLPKYTPVLPMVTEQPPVDSKEMIIVDSAVSHHRDGAHDRCGCQHDDELMYSNSNHAHSHGHRRCHNSRLKRYLLPALALLLLLFGLMAISCMQGYDSILSEWGSGTGEGLFSRALGSGTTNGSGSSFTHRKLYLIVIFVGLFLVLVLGVMLSAWCCRGSFQNPLCCPCYLCACCGGLACLDCIACGLCVDAAENM